MKFPWHKYIELPLSKRNTFQIFITNQCNHSCPGCFARNVIKVDPSAHISMDEYRVAVVIAKRKGAKQINILGGEPMLHGKLDMFCAYNKELGLKTTIYTNGTLLSRWGDVRCFHGAKIRVSISSFKEAGNLTRSGWAKHVDANYMITSKTSIGDLLASAHLLGSSGCNVFFVFDLRECKNKDAEFFDSSAPNVLPVMEYKKLIHEFLKFYEGTMEIHISKRGVFESTLSLPHNKCKFANYFVGGKIIQCPYDIVNLKYQDTYEYDTRHCQQNSTCLMSKIKLLPIKAL